MANTRKDLEQDMPLELTDQQLEKVDGGADAGNLLFTGKSAKPIRTIQRGEAPKAGQLIHKEENDFRKKSIEEKDGLDGILLSGGGPKIF